MTFDPGAIGEFIQRFGLPLAALIILIITGHRRYWVFGWYADELRARAEKAEAQRDRALGAAETAVNVTERVT